MFRYRQQEAFSITEGNLYDCKQIDNPQYRIIIPKLGIIAPIVPNVSVTNEKEYNEALQQGVAQAVGTHLPSEEPGNTYLFAHSTPSIFDIQRYSAYFTLLHRLGTEDEIYIEFQGKRFLYSVKSNDVVKAFDLTPLESTYDTPTLTLQTCDPPGIPINRRIVTAELVEVSGCDTDSSTNL